MSGEHGVVARGRSQEEPLQCFSDLLWRSYGVLAKLTYYVVGIMRHIDDESSPTESNKLYALARCYFVPVICFADYASEMLERFD